MNDDEYLTSLHAALARETDKKRFEQLLTELERFNENRIKRERTVPTMERR